MTNSGTMITEHCLVFYHVSGLIQRSGHTSVAFWHCGGILFTTIKCLNFVHFVEWFEETSHHTSQAETTELSQDS